MVVHLLKHYGAVITATVTSVRKCISIVLSFILFPKPISFYFLVGVAFVSFGIIVDVLGKNLDSSSKKKGKETPVV